MQDLHPEKSGALFTKDFQPAQKWLKDRKGRKLEFEDMHYQRMIVALTETVRIMGEIDESGITNQE